jgi:hypothetical protein
MVLCLAALMLPAISSAQPQDDLSSINVTSTNPSYSGCADPFFEVIDAGNCLDLGGARIAGPAFIWVVASRTGGYPDGIGGIQYGIEHDLAIQGWTLCTGGAEIPQDGWPDSGTGTAATWEGGCYSSPGENAMVGFASVADGSLGNLQITGDPRLPEPQALWADCSAVEYEICPAALGSMDVARCESCVGLPTQTTSWGAIKSLY